MTTESLGPDNEALGLLRQAQAEHTLGHIASALALVRRSIAADAELADAWMYLGTTLITKRLQFGEGLEALERAVALAPDDAGVNYSMGWCYEFVAYRLSRQGRLPYRDPDELWELAAEYLQRCIDLDPEQGLKDDAKDLRDSILARY